MCALPVQNILLRYFEWTVIVGPLSLGCSFINVIYDDASADSREAYMQPS